MNIGIDLGTTFSSVAICYEENGKLVVEEIELASANGETKIPSVIYVKKDGSTVVGAAALNYLATEPDRVFQWFKRDMGGDKPVRTVDGVGWTPEMLSAEILKVLKRDAEKWLEEMGEKLTGTVVCVPAWFGDRQCAATREAIEMAGLTLVDMRAEPSAAALAVAMTRPDEITDRHVLVYDLGGGTFDVVLIKTEKTDSPLPRITTLCRAGHFDLGGHNWDEKLADIFANGVSRNTNTIQKTTSGNGSRHSSAWRPANAITAGKVRPSCSPSACAGMPSKSRWPNSTRSPKSCWTRRAR